MKIRHLSIVVVFAFCFAFSTSLFAADEMLGVLRADWAAQEKRAGREVGSLESIQTALEKTEKLLGAANEKTQTFRERCEAFDAVTEADRYELYEAVKLYGREVALSNPLVPTKPILFLKQRRWIDGVFSWCVKFMVIR